MTKEQAKECIIDMMDGMPSDKCADWIEALNIALDAIDTYNPFNDFEKRIFLAAMTKEREACKNIVVKYHDKDLLIPLCNSIEYKVKHSSLWKEVEE